MLLRHRLNGRMHLIVAAVAALAGRVSIQLSLAAAEATAAPLAELLSVGRSAWRAPTRPQHRTCTAACTDQRSINQCERQRYAVVRLHSYLHLTCVVGRRIQICSCCSRGRSSFQPAFCSMDDGRALWLHASAMPCRRAHMPCMPQLRNGCCSRKAAKSAISLTSTLQTLHGIKQTHAYMFVVF